MDSEEINIRNQEIFSNSAKFWINLANQQLFELNKQLLAFAVVLLPLSSSILLVESITLKEFQKTLLGLSWLFLVISIALGSIQIIIDAKYFAKLSRDSSRREVIWHQRDKTIEQKQDETDNIENVPSSSTFIPLIGQAFTIFIAFAMIISIAVSLLFTK